MDKLAGKAVCILLVLLPIISILKVGIESWGSTVSIVWAYSLLYVGIGIFLIPIVRNYIRLGGMIVAPSETIKDILSFRDVWFVPGLLGTSSFLTAGWMSRLSVASGDTGPINEDLLLFYIFSLLMHGGFWIMHTWIVCCLAIMMRIRTQLQVVFHAVGHTYVSILLFSMFLGGLAIFPAQGTDILDTIIFTIDSLLPHIYSQDPILNFFLISLTGFLIGSAAWVLITLHKLSRIPTRSECLSDQPISMQK